MAATNRPEILDTALLRAGRFDRHVLVDRPDKAGRARHLEAACACRGAGVGKRPRRDRRNDARLRGRGPREHRQRSGPPCRPTRPRARSACPRLQEAVERVVAGLEKKNRVLNPMERERRCASRDRSRARCALDPGQRHGTEDLDHPTRDRGPRLHRPAAHRGPLPHDAVRAGEQDRRALGRTRGRGDHLRRVSRPAPRTICEKRPISPRAWSRCTV